MRRLLSLGLALALLSAFMALPASAQAKLSCSNPTVVTGYHDTLSYPPYIVQQDVWQETGTQTMSVCSEHEWDATVNQPGDPVQNGVRTYPDSQKTYTDWANCSSAPRVDSFTALHGDFAMSAPAAGSYDEAWDVFLNAPVNQGQTSCGTYREIMVLNRWRNVTFPTPQLNKTIVGTNYDIWHGTAPTGPLVQLYQTTQTDSGTAKLGQIFTYLEGQGLMSASDKLSFVAYGVEVLAMHVDHTFSLTNFSITDS